MRRTAATVALLLVAAGLGLAPAAPAAGEDVGRDGAGLVAVQARPADHLVEAFGVQTHLAYPDTPYQDVPRVVDALTGLGVRHVRDQVFSLKPPLYDAMEQVAAAGVRFNVIVGRPGSWDTPARVVETIATQLPPGVVESLEGANEWNLAGCPAHCRPNWAAEVREHQRQIHEAAKADPATAELPILAPSLGMRRGFEELGDLGVLADLGNAHIYPGGLKPSSYVQHVLNAERIVVPDAPVVVTEGGYHDAMTSTSSHPPVPQAVSGVYVPRLLLEHFLAGTDRFYLYQLLDEPEKEGRSLHESHFGLMTTDFTPKPAYDALRRLLALASDPGSSFTPGSLTYRLSGAPADLRQVLLQRRDGTFALLLWRDVSVYDRVLRRETTVEPRRVTIELAEPADARLWRPSVAEGPVARATGSTLYVDVAADVAVVDLDNGAPPPPAGPAPEPASTPRAFEAVEGDRTIDLTWEPPADDGGSPVLRYDLSGVPGFPSFSVPGDTAGVTVPGLRNGTRYAVWVQAVTSAGPSAPALVRARPARRPGKPRDVVGEVTGRNKVVVRWAPPKSDGGADLDRYRVREKRSGQTRRVGPETLEVGFRLPLSQRVARVVVVARNDVGVGKPRGTGRIRLR